MPPPITITERVLAEWVDENRGQTCSLGSCSLANRQAPKFTFRAHADSETRRLHLLFSLVVTVKAAGKTLKRELFLVIPPRALGKKDGHCPLMFESLTTSQLNSTSLLDASVLQDAELTAAGRIIRARFNLATGGYVVMPRSTSKTIKPSTSTSRDLLLGLKSLSNVLRFTIYMKPSDYALVGLKALCDHLQDNNGHDKWTDIDLAGMYDNGRDAVILDWDRVESKSKKDAELPPPYEFVQVAQSPALCLDAASSPQSGEQLKTPCIAETPRATDSLSSPPVSVRHGIFSDPDFDGDRFALPDTESPRPPSNLFDSDDERFALLHASCPETPCNVDSDEECFALCNARETSLALKQDTASGDDGEGALFSELVEWISGARAIRSNVHKHPHLLKKLDALGQHTRTGNIVAFDAIRVWCSAFVFFHGVVDEAIESHPVSQRSCEMARMFVSDIADLVRWANERGRLCEMCVSPVRDEFVRLGEAARAAIMSDTGTLAAYERQKDVCIARVLFMFGNAK